MMCNYKSFVLPWNDKIGNNEKLYVTFNFTMVLITNSVVRLIDMKWNNDNFCFLIRI